MAIGWKQIEEAIDAFLIVEKSAAAKKAAKRGLKHTSFGRYADASGKVVAITKGDKLVPVKGAKKPTKPPRAAKKPAAKAKKPAKKKPAAKVAGIPERTFATLSKTLDRIKDSKLKKEASRFVADLTKVSKRPNAKNIQALIKKWGLATNEAGEKIYIERLNAVKGKLKRTDNLFGIKSDIVKLLSSTKAILPMKDGMRFLMKPNHVYTKTTTVTSKKKTDKVGNLISVSFAGTTYNKQPIPDKKQLQALFVQRGMNKAEAKGAAERVSFSVMLYNQKVDELASIGEIKVADYSGFSGKTDAEKIANAAVKGIDNAFKRSGEKPTKGSREIKKRILDMAKSATIEEFERKWIEFHPKLVGDMEGLRAASPYICETVSAIRHAMLGKRVIVPMDETFPTSDVIALSKKNIVAIGDPRKLVEKADFIFAGIRGISVKENAGGASSSRAKISLTEFSSPAVKKDLIYLADESLQDVFYGDPAKATRNLRGMVDKYKADITAYYGFSPKMNTAAIIKALSTGNRPFRRKGDTKTRIPEDAAMFSSDKFTKTENAKRNTRTWRLASSFGLVTEAVYNRHTQYQLYTNEAYKKTGISTTNGINRLGKMGFQFVKGLRSPAGSDVVLPDSSYVSHIRNVDREDMQSGL